MSRRYRIIIFYPLVEWRNCYAGPDAWKIKGLILYIRVLPHGQNEPLNKNNEVPDTMLTMEKSSFNAHQERL